MSAKCFQSERTMSDYQASRELDEALRVQAMLPDARFEWLQETWGHLQDGAALLFTNVEPVAGVARHYASLDEKNQFDEAREIRLALEMHLKF